jgi:hypothetical protein
MTTIFPKATVKQCLKVIHQHTVKRSFKNLWGRLGGSLDIGLQLMRKSTADASGWLRNDYYFIIGESTESLNEYTSLAVASLLTGDAAGAGMREFYSFCTDASSKLGHALQVGQRSGINKIKEEHIRELAIQYFLNVNPTVTILRCGVVRFIWKAAHLKDKAWIYVLDGQPSPGQSARNYASIYLKNLILNAHQPNGQPDTFFLGGGASHSLVYKFKLNTGELTRYAVTSDGQGKHDIGDVM